MVQTEVKKRVFLFIYSFIFVERESNFDHLHFRFEPHLCLGFEKSSACLLTQLIWATL